jgi:hypothetical protein
MVENGLAELQGVVGHALDSGKEKFPDIATVFMFIMGCKL